ncbi:MAG: hypothetical protein ACXABY_37290 [Candidatus Thorarchaeota archaeon]|jgi:hypothetical protein
MATWSIAALRTILATETDFDSGGSEELLSQIRENWEALTMLAFDTGITTTSTTIAETIWTDTGSPFANVEVGMTLLITSGVAIGNTYTIDATNGTTTVTCTGDTLVTDGVIVTDTAKVMYDLKVNTDGHDHDGVNAKKVAAIADNAVDLAAMADNAIGTAELRTATNSASGTTGTLASFGTNSTVTHFPMASGATNTSANLQIYVTISGGGTVYGSALYHTTSSPYGWVFAVRDKSTKVITVASFSQDHPCYNEGRGAGNPDKRPHPFSPDNYDPATEEIICIILEPWELDQITKDSMKLDQECALHEILTNYDIDDVAEIPWPEDELISIGWEYDPLLPGKKVKEHFQKIKKHTDVKRYAIKKKGT